jgi:hypothetical protein
MPFTAAHPLVVLPMVHRARPLRLDPTALIIGSMAPDFEYFVRGEQVGMFSHSLLGIVTFCIPMTVVLGVLYHSLVKWSVLLVAPAGLARRAAGVMARPWQNRWTAGAIASVLVSAAIGSFSHVAWDGFTHAQGWFVTRFPATFKAPVDVPVLGTLALHRVLQHISTAVGLPVVMYFAIRAIRRATPVELPAAKRWLPRALFLACVAVAIVLVVMRSLAHHLTDPGNLVIAPISGLLAGSLVASVILRGRALPASRPIAAA